MTAPTPYLLLPATARQALTFYAEVFGGEAVMYTFGEFNRSDGPPEAIAHGSLRGGPVDLSAADASPGDRPSRAEGLMLALLGVAAPTILRKWFSRLAEGGRVVDDLQVRPWGASDGRVIDRYGVEWLIGFEDGDS